MMKNFDQSVEINHNIQINYIFLTIIIESLLLVVQYQEKLNKT